MTDLPTVVTRAQSGDDTAFAELVRRFQDMAYAFAYARLHDFQLAEDAAQEAFVEAYRCLPNLIVPEAFPAWLKRIVLKHCDRLTRRKRVTTTPLESATGLSAVALGPEELIERRDAQAEVLAAVTALPQAQREVTTLYYIDGYSQAEIAAFLDVPTSTVKSRLHTSRQTLRERMMSMVRDALQSSALPESFTEATLVRAIADAAGLNRSHRFGEAESLLRDVLTKTPPSATAVRAAALRELNRTLMWGQYEDGVFDARYDELSSNGRDILAAVSTGATTLDPAAEEAIWQQLAQTLLYIPRMGEAVAHLEAWIARSGASPERVGMLAWATGCTGAYAEAEALWRRFLALTEEGSPDDDEAADEEQDLSERAAVVEWVCLTLVDCFAAAGAALARTDLRKTAARIAGEGWAAARRLGGPAGILTPRTGVVMDPAWTWVDIAYRAGLPYGQRACALSAELAGQPVAGVEGVILGLRTWSDDVAAIRTDWLRWIRARVRDGDWHEVEAMRRRIRGFIHTGRPEALTALSQEVLSILREAQGEPAQAAVRAWTWTRYDVWAYHRNNDIAGALRVAREMVTALGVAEGGSVAVIAAAAAGLPTPPDVVALLDQEGPTALDPAGLFGWYAIAREAAAAGRTERALEALSHALDGWTNPPLGYMHQWESDPYWGDMTDDSRRQALFAAKRARIGPVYGELFYFPGW